MYLKSFRILIAILVMTAPGCAEGEKQQLEQKRRELDRRERELEQREQELALKQRIPATEAAPTALGDSLAAISRSLEGNWAASMTCTQTDCPGSAVGDTKNEDWQIRYEAPALVARALSKGQLVRVYHGFFTGNTVELVERHADSAGIPATRMVARLSILDSTQMSGQREITRDNCKTIYSLQLTRQ